jgi:hypothetical protein
MLITRCCCCCLGCCCFCLKVPRFEQFMSNLPVISEQELYKLSLVCEPRGAKKKDLP